MRKAHEKTKRSHASLGYHRILRNHRATRVQLEQISKIEVALSNQDPIFGIDTEL